MEKKHFISIELLFLQEDSTNATTPTQPCYILSFWSMQFTLPANCQLIWLKSFVHLHKTITRQTQTTEARQRHSKPNLGRI